MPQLRNKPTSPFSLRLPDDTRNRLEEEARRSERSASFVATKAIEAFLDARDRKRIAIESTIAEADNGAFVSQEAVDSWMDSWGAANELSFPDPDVTLPRK